jgi:hypothetical protein
MLIQKSTRAGKRFMATYANGKVVHFGQAGGRTYIDEGDKMKRAAYLARHSKRENWNDPYSAGALSRWLLWGDTTSLDTNHDAFMKRFGVK